jgi:MSHA biogenesis protein MshG
MPQFKFKGRDPTGGLRTGERSADSIDALGAILIKEGITPIEIKIAESTENPLDSIMRFLRVHNQQNLEDLSIFVRQMQLLTEAGVPMIVSLAQIASLSRTKRLKYSIEKCIEYLEKGERLSGAMRHFPDIFSKLVINIVEIGENTGRLSDAFGHLHDYLTFETENQKKISSTFRYPIFMVVMIVSAVLLLNIFVIPTFAGFYSKASTSLPWQTQVLMGMSSFFIHHGFTALMVMLGVFYAWVRYLNTHQGRLFWDRFQLRIPMIGSLIKRIILIRFSQALAIILNSGISVVHAFHLVNDLLKNVYIKSQIDEAIEAIERGSHFTKAIENIELLTSIEMQIIGVGEQNGQIGAAMQYIGNFHRHEIEYDLKKLNEWVSIVLTSVVAVFILLMALGIYLPIWNMSNMMH